MMNGFKQVDSIGAPSTSKLTQKNKWRCLANLVEVVWYSTSYDDDKANDCFNIDDDMSMELDVKVETNLNIDDDDIR